MDESQSTTTDVAQAIRENAAAPAKLVSDGTSAEQHPLGEQIAADRYLSSKDAVAKPSRGLRFGRIVAPGAP